ncbi:MAG TPA: hypothetical protein VJ792_00390 [Candidatus Nitrosotalea sp.]|nr:hypothetical protein [Candidatus Nitrosotalea sp.]
MVKKCPDCCQPLVEYDTGSNTLHCPNPDCVFQYVDCRTGKEHRKDSP